jgi:hypothetical protein
VVWLGGTLAHETSCYGDPIVDAAQRNL